MPVSPAELRAAAAAADPPRGFAEALRKARGMAVIAEVKRGSPSAGTICAEFDPVAVATGYDAAGANCLSVLTDGPYFQGSLDDFRAVRTAVARPMLRKDFLLDVRQVDEARAAGADAVLLIAECLPQDDLQRLYDRAGELEMDALIELYEESNMERVLDLGPTMIGVNNRDLRTFEVDLMHSRRLRAQVPPGVLFVSESGIRSGEEARELADAGVDAVLVGETLMRAADVPAKMAELALR